MCKTRTIPSSSSYESSYGASGLIAAPQKIAEILCERAAARNGLTLPPRFWNHPRWTKPFVRQVQAANALLRVYSPLAIFAAIRSHPTIHSLQPAFVADLVHAEQITIDGQIAAAEAAPSPDLSNPSEPRRPPPPRGNNIRSQLKERPLGQE